MVPENRHAFVPTPRQEEARNLIRRCKYTLLAGGSRSGKTALFIYYLICRALLEPCRQAILRFHFNDVKRSVGMDTLPKILDLMGCTNYILNKSDWVYSIPTMSGKLSEIWLGGLDDKERVEKILGNEYSTIYINEASQVSYQAYTTALTRLSQNTGLENKVFIDCNPPEKSHWLYQMFVLKKEPMSGKDLPFPELYGMMQMNPVDNPHLPRDYIDHVLAVLPERQKQRFLYGEWLDKREGSLWTRTAIDAFRLDMPRRKPTLRVIAVDPAVTAHASSDETGIVIVSRDYAGHMYVEEDLSGTYTPAAWAALVMQKYADRRLDAVVAEVNQGGDFIETTLRSQADGRTFTYCPVRATQGKLMRAEPVAAAYERGLVHHIGYFPELEEQLLEWTPSERKSPDRMDALVWAITYLIRKGESAYGDLPNEPCISDYEAGCFLGREVGFTPEPPAERMFLSNRFPFPPRIP